MLWEYSISSTTRLYASIQIGFFRCCCSAFKQIQSISFSSTTVQQAKREKENREILFNVHFSFSLSVHHDRPIACMQSTMTMLTSDHIYINQSWLLHVLRVDVSASSQSRQIMLLHIYNNSLKVFSHHEIKRIRSFEKKLTFSSTHCPSK